LDLGLTARLRHEANDFFWVFPEMVPFGFEVDTLAQGIHDVLIGALRVSEKITHLNFFFLAQAKIYCAVYRQANAIAGGTKVLADRCDESHLGFTVGRLPISGGTTTHFPNQGNQTMVKA
jgi:hypothetical protein